MASTMASICNCVITAFGCIPTYLQWSGGLALCDPLISGMVDAITGVFNLIRMGM